MSRFHPASFSLSYFQLTINNALRAYERFTNQDLLTHPLASRLQACSSPGAILAVLWKQVQGLDQSRSGDDRRTKWLDPTVSIIYALSGTLGEDVDLQGFLPATAVFTGVGVLLLATKDVLGGQDGLCEVFERLESYFRRLEIYTEVRPTTEMMDTTTRIIVEVLSILGIATKEIKQGRMKNRGKKQTGSTDIGDLEDALKRLDKLTFEEARMANEESMKASTAMSLWMQAVNDTVASVDDNVARVIHGGEPEEAMNQTPSDVVRMKRSNNQPLENIYKWLSPPDQSTDNKLARQRGIHYANWLFLGSIFKEWKSGGSLLWIHGKPGSGKSNLCSMITDHFKALCEAGQASMASFYFDFRNANKRGWHDLVASLLIQLSARSRPCYDILFELYSAHDSGKKPPSDNALTEGLKDMLTLLDQRPIYLIMDALDESSNTYGIPTPRERVLQLLKELVDLHLSNLRICVTSRPEIDIRDVLEPLTSHKVSLHDEIGQKKNITAYIRFIVYSYSETYMRRWTTEDREFVIKVLSERADGMFRWVVAQLEVLRRCPSESIRRTLDELLGSLDLDETYERMLKEIRNSKKEHARRIFQCLVVAIRPLRVEELAEVLAADFDDPDGTPNSKPSWRREDQEQAILTACSGLITIVDEGRSRAVRFSHFSVKEFLTSDRLALSSGDISRYHIMLEPAHITLAQACLSILLQPGDRVKENGAGRWSPLARYAAQHWVTHAQSAQVSSSLQKAMEYLFDLNKPYFSSWCQLHDIDFHPSDTVFHESTPTTASTPLYYAALCGFSDLVEHLIIKHPQHVNAIGGYYLTPTAAALAGRHFHTAQVLLCNGSSVDPRGHCGTSLHSAVYYGNLELIQVFLDHGADVNAQCGLGSTPLHVISYKHSDPSFHLRPRVTAARMLLAHGADVMAKNKNGETPLHVASQEDDVEVVHILLRYGADVMAQNKDGETPLHLVSREDKVAFVRLLLHYGADVMTQNKDGETPLHMASREEKAEVVYTLLDHGASFTAWNKDGEIPLHLASRERKVDVVHVLRLYSAGAMAENKNGETPLHLASRVGKAEVAHILLRYGAGVMAKNKDGETPLHLASREGKVEVVHILLRYSAYVMAKNKDGETPLHLASREGKVEVIHVLCQHGTYVMAQNNDEETPLHLASREEVIHVLLQYGADVMARNKDGETPLHLASREDKVEAIHVLLQCDADAMAHNKDQETPLHLASREGKSEAVHMLLNRRVDVMAQNKDGWNPFHIALSKRHVELVRIFIEHPASEIAQGKDKWTPFRRAPFGEYVDVAQVLLNNGHVIAPDRRRLTPLHLASGGHAKLALILLEHSADTGQHWLGWTPLHLALSGEHAELTHILLERGADAEARDNDGYTPLHWASQQGQSEVVRVLVKHGVDADARDDDNCTPLHWGSQQGHSEVVRVLVEHGMDLNARDQSNWTPLHGASQYGHLEVVQFLLEHGADPHALDQGGWTPLQWPSYNGDFEIVRVLLEHGADANTRDNSNWTPLHGASQMGHREVIQVLLEHGANVNSHDNSTQTPLHLASRAGHYGVVLQLLIESDADICASRQLKFGITKAALPSRKRRGTL